VTYQSRRICSCCRLAKCFRVGMKRALILSDAEREARKELVQQNRLKRAQGAIMPSVNLVCITSGRRESKRLKDTDGIVFGLFLDSTDADVIHNR
jgi:hypothetical protein